MEAERFGAIIFTSNMIDNAVQKIYDINKQLNFLEDQIKRSKDYRLKQYLKENFENLQNEKENLISQVVRLRKDATSIIFKDSGDYTYIDDKDEFDLNRNNDTLSLKVYLIVKKLLSANRKKSHHLIKKRDSLVK